MRYFYQDFLFEGIPLNQYEMPVVTVKEIPEDDLPLPIAGPYPMEPYLEVKFSYLQRLKSEEQWQSFLQECSHSDAVYLLDDMPIVNAEIQPFKELYLKTYYWTISQHCKQAYVVHLKQANGLLSSVN